MLSLGLCCPWGSAEIRLIDRRRRRAPHRTPHRFASLLRHRFASLLRHRLASLSRHRFAPQRNSLLQGYLVIASTFAHRLPTALIRGRRMARILLHYTDGVAADHGRPRATSVQSWTAACAGAAAADGATRFAPLFRGRRLRRASPNDPLMCSRAGQRSTALRWKIVRRTPPCNRRHTPTIVDKLRNLTRSFRLLAFV